MPTLHVNPTKVAKKSIIVISWPCKASWDLLNSLKRGCYLNCTSDLNESASNTVLLFSLFKYVEYKLGGTSVDASRGKFAQVKIDVQADTAIMTVITEPSFSAVRIALRAISKTFAPAKLMSLYKKYMQLLELKVIPGNFVHSCNEMVASASRLTVYATGTFKIPDGNLPKLKELVDDIKPEKADGKAEAPAKSTDAKSDWSEVKCGSRLEAFILQQLLTTIQVESHIRDGNLIPITGSSSWETVKKKLDARRIGLFVDNKLMKLGDKLPDILSFTCAQTGYFDAAELDKLPKSYTSASLTALVKKHL